MSEPDFKASTHCLYKMTPNEKPFHIRLQTHHKLQALAKLISLKKRATLDGGCNLWRSICAWIYMVYTYLYKSYVQEARLSGRQAVVHLLLKVISVLNAFYFDFLSAGLLLSLSLSFFLPLCFSFFSHFH